MYGTRVALLPTDETDKPEKKRLDFLTIVEPLLCTSEPVLSPRVTAGHDDEIVSALQ